MNRETEALLEHRRHNHLLCWKSVLAGVFISIMSYLILTALGAGVVGGVAQTAIEAEKGGLALATGAGLWLGLSAVISVFMGSYFAARLSGYAANKIGAAHGFVVASVFFSLMAYGMGGLLSSAAQGIAKGAAAIGSGGADLASNPQVQDVLNKAIGDSKLKSDPKEVIQGLTTRVVLGDFDSAKAYFAYQTGMTPPEVDARMAQIKAELTEVAKRAGEASSRAVANAGWSLFVTFLAGVIAALIGGHTGAHANVARPIAREDVVGYRPILAGQNGSIAPYLFGWILGVPISILFLIFMLRAVF